MALQKDLDSLVLPAVPKSQLRDRLGELRKQPPALMLCVQLVHRGNMWDILGILGISSGHLPVLSTLFFLGFMSIGPSSLRRAGQRNEQQAVCDNSVLTGKSYNFQIVAKSAKSSISNPIGKPSFRPTLWGIHVTEWIHPKGWRWKIYRVASSQLGCRMS